MNTAQPNTAQMNGADGSPAFPIPYYDPYVGLVRTILAFGDEVPDRTGTGTKEIFGCMLSYNLEAGFPLTPLKKTNFTNVLVEILWLLRGESHLGFMHENNVKHWDPWIPADERFGKGDLGRVYGVQWKNWRVTNPTDPEAWWTVDQIGNLIDGIKENPHGRRHMVTAWNPGELDQMALPPCHYGFQCHVDSKGRMSMLVNQRSADFFIGVPYDVGMYALLLHMIAAVTGYTAGQLTFSFGSAHLYLNHLDLAMEMIQREARPFPTLEINPMRKFRDLEDFRVEDFALVGYSPHPFMKAPVAV